MVNGAKAAEPKSSRKRGLSLFEKVTGTGRAAKAETAPDKQETGQAEIGGLDPTDRLPETQSGDDLLDIPAFLRRQAN